MGFQNDKSEVFEQMGVFNVIAGLPKTKTFNSMESITSKSRNLLPFLLDLLSSSCLDNAKTLKDKARCEAGRILIEILTEFLPVLIKIIKEGVVQGIKAGLACGTDFTIPNPTPELTTTIDKLDLNDMMKMDPNGPAGLLFGDPNRDFNKFLYERIENQDSLPWQDKNGSDLLDVTYNQPTPSTNNQPTITLKISNNRANSSFHDFLVDYINSVELFSIKNVMGNIMDMTFGMISQANNIGVDVLISQSKMDSSVEKILDVDVCVDKVKLDDSFFDFGNEELERLEREAGYKSRGVNVVDLGCGLVEVEVSRDILDNLKNLDTANTPKKVKNILEQTLESTGTAITQSGNETDGPTMKLNFQTNAVLSFPKVLTRMVITPKIVSLYQISHQTVNDIVLDVSSGYDFSKAARTFFDFVVREAAGALLEIIFNKIKKELIALITRVVTKIIKEKIQLYIGSIAGIYGQALSSIAGNIVDSAAGGATDAIGTIQTPNTSNFV